MKTFNYPEPVYAPGQYRLTMHRPIQWYGNLVRQYGHKLKESHVNEVMNMMVDKVFGQEFDFEEIEKFLFNDGLSNKEAEHAIKELEYQILAEITSFFPRIGGELPKDMYCFDRPELVIYVPDKYEDQRGYFF